MGLMPGLQVQPFDSSRVSSSSVMGWMIGTPYQRSSSRTWLSQSDTVSPGGSSHLWQKVMWSIEELLSLRDHLIDGRMGQTFSQRITFIASLERSQAVRLKADTINGGSSQKRCISVSRSGSLGNAVFKRGSRSREYT